MSTRRVIVKRICDKCLTTKKREVDAASTERFSLNGYKYEIDLCADHAAELYGSIMKWADLGTETGKPTRFDVAKAPTTIVVPETASAPVPKSTPVPAAPVLPKTAEKWKLTEHVLQRMDERQVSKEDLLWACERPESVQSDPAGLEHIRHHYRGDLIAVVDHYSHTVLTVKRKSLYDPALDKKQRVSA